MHDFKETTTREKNAECGMKMFSRPVDFHDHLFDRTHLHQVFSLHWNIKSTNFSLPIASPSRLLSLKFKKIPRKVVVDGAHTKMGMVTLLERGRIECDGMNGKMNHGGTSKAESTEQRKKMTRFCFLAIVSRSFSFALSLATAARKLKVSKVSALIIK